MSQKQQKEANFQQNEQFIEVSLSQTEINQLTTSRTVLFPPLRGKELLELNGERYCAKTFPERREYDASNGLKISKLGKIMSATKLLPILPQTTNQPQLFSKNLEEELMSDLQQIQFQFANQCSNQPQNIEIQKKEPENEVQNNENKNEVENKLPLENLQNPLENPMELKFAQAASENVILQNLAAKISQQQSEVLKERLPHCRESASLEILMSWRDELVQEEFGLAPEDFPGNLGVNLGSLTKNEICEVEKELKVIVGERVKQMIGEMQKINVGGKGVGWMIEEKRKMW